MGLVFISIFLVWLCQCRVQWSPLSHGATILSRRQALGCGPWVRSLRRKSLSRWGGPWEPFRSPVPSYVLGGGALPLLIFLRFFLCIIAKKKWRSSLRGGKAPSFHSTGRPATNEVCLALVRQADAGSVLSARGPGGEKPLNWVGWVGNVWIKGVACRFSLVKLSLCDSKRKLVDSKATVFGRGVGGGRSYAIAETLLC